MLFKVSNNLVQIYRSFSITGNYGRRSFSKYGISYYDAHALIAKYGIDIQIVRPEMTKFKIFREFSKHGFLFCGNYILEQKERLCLIIDKCRRQKLCKRAQKISAAAPLRVMASRYNPCE